TRSKQTQAFILDNGPDATKYVLAFQFSEGDVCKLAEPKFKTHDDLLHTEREQFEIVKRCRRGSAVIFCDMHCNAAGHHKANEENSRCFCGFMPPMSLTLMLWPSVL
ncbi:hypothetical protein QQF64_034720, partial [Cirrhinus molitorella]